MKKIRNVLLALALLTGIAFAETDRPELTGVVLEITEDGFALDSDEGIRFVILSENTVYDGSTEITEGDTVTVLYEGRTDRRSVNAELVRCYSLTGEVTVIHLSEEPWLLLLPEGEEEPVQVNLTEEQAEGLHRGGRYEVWFSGAMTASIPPQISAMAIAECMEPE